MNPAVIQPLSPGVEPTGETLARFSANIATLSGIIDEAESRGRIYLARLFTQARTSKVAEALAFIAALAASARSLPVPLANLSLPPPEVRQWQGALNEGWHQEV